MSYTPEPSLKSSSTLRKIAWALDMPMTRAIERIFEYLPEVLDREKVCQKCRDKSKCRECPFSNHNSKEVNL